MASQSPHVVTETGVGRGRRRVGRTGDGYRYDHAHCTADLTTNLLACDYIHQPRLNRLIE